MPVAAGGHHGNTSGATAIVMVPSPPQGVSRMVKWVNVHNADTVDATVTIRKVVKIPEGGENTYKIRSEVVASGNNLQLSEVIVLAGSREKIEVLLGGAVTANELNFETSWGDQT